MVAATSASVWATAPDGTQLHALYGGTFSNTPPLLCLPGLTRNHRDFEPVFERFGASRRIIAMDFRGRGRSAHADPLSYRPDVECTDVLTLLDTLKIHRVAVLGTSRGGIVGMIMVNLNPDRVAGLMLNDVGPVLEPEGLLRIAAYVGKPVRFMNWQEAAQAIALSSAGFANVSAEQWNRAAMRMFRENDGHICENYDVGLAQTFPSRDDITAGKVSDLWALVPALSGVPTALLRGAGSDLLAAATVAEFKSRLPELMAVEVPDRGHVPFLDEPQSVDTIRRWLDTVDRNEKDRETRP